MNFPYKAVLQAARGEHAKGRGGLLFSPRAFSSRASSFALKNPALAKQAKAGYAKCKI